MTDSNCTREGYDYVPRYRAPDQCPECRCAPGTDHNPGCMFGHSIDIEELVAIPLDIQEHVFDLAVDGAVMEVERLMLDPEPIIALARERLRQGYEEYACTMFTWDAETRRRNVLEELADALVYLVSGPLE